MPHDPVLEATRELLFAYVAVCAQLTACLAWCVEHDGECLADHPEQLARMRDVIAQARRVGQPEEPGNDA